MSLLSEVESMFAGLVFCFGSGLAWSVCLSGLVWLGFYTTPAFLVVSSNMSCSGLVLCMGSWNKGDRGGGWGGGGFEH